MPFGGDFQYLLDAKLREVQSLVMGEVERLSALSIAHGEPPRQGKQAFPTLSQVDPVHPDVWNFQTKPYAMALKSPAKLATPKFLTAHLPAPPSVEPPSCLPSVLPMSEAATVSPTSKVESLSTSSRMSSSPPKLTFQQPSFSDSLLPKDSTEANLMSVHPSIAEMCAMDDTDATSRWGTLVAKRWMKAHVCFLNDVWTEASLESMPSVTNVVQSMAGLLARNVSLQASKRDSRKSKHPPSRWLDQGRLKTVRRTMMSVKNVVNASPQSNARSLMKSVWSKMGPLHPFARTRVMWDLIGVCMLGLDIIMMPLPVFDEKTKGLPTYYNDFSDNLDMVAVCYWTVDILVSFFTGFTATDGNVEMRLFPIARNYMRRWFVFDMIVVMTDWVSFITGGANHGSMLRLARTALRMARLLRVVKMSRALHRAVMTVNSEFLLTVLGVAKLMLIIVAVNHYVACGWFWLGTLSRNTWIDNELHRHSAAYAYFTSLHWSLTQFTPASMEVHPYNEQERCYNVVVIIVAMLTFSSFISSITQAMTHFANTNKQKAQQEVAIRHYLFEHNISHQLTGRIWAYVQHSRITAAKRIRYTDIPCLMRMPDSIKKELRVEIFLPVLLVHPLLDFYNLIDSNALASICRHAALETYLGAREEHLGFGRVINSMFSVMDGSIEYIEHQVQKRSISVFGRKTVSKPDADADAEANVQLNSGQWACEIALWANAVRNTGSFQAVCASEIVTLNAQAFREHALQHHASVDILRRYAKLFVERFNEASEQELNTNILFNDSKHICSMVQQLMDSDLKVKRMIGGHIVSSQSSTVSIEFTRLTRRNKSDATNSVSSELQNHPLTKHASATSLQSRDSTAEQPDNAMDASNPRAAVSNVSGHQSGTSSL